MVFKKIVSAGSFRNEQILIKKRIFEFGLVEIPVQIKKRACILCIPLLFEFY